MSGVTQKAVQGGELEVEEDEGEEGGCFSINRFAQGLVGDFLGKVLGPSRTRSNLVDKSATLGAWSLPFGRLVLRVIYVLPGGRTQAHDSPGWINQEPARS